MYNNSHEAGLLGKIVAQEGKINIYGLDFINAGQSQSNQPGYYKSVDYLVDQAYNFIKFIAKKFDSNSKVFISGASMGGMVCFELAIRYSKMFDGVIFSAQQSDRFTYLTL